jgi:hypothetical protein
LAQNALAELKIKMIEAMNHIACNWFIVVEILQPQTSSTMLNNGLQPRCSSTDFYTILSHDTSTTILSMVAEYRG